MAAALTVEAALLRTALTEVRMTVGTVLPARVLERHDKVGLLLLAGVPLTAELPDDVEAGSRLKLRVGDLAAERVVLRILDHIPPPPPQPAHSRRAELPLPDGRAASVRAERSGATVRLLYESPELGPVELTLALAGGTAISAGVRTEPGRAAAMARDAGPQLRESIMRATGLSAEVAVGARPLQRYA